MAASGPLAFSNTYEDDERAASYARLAYPGTYYLAFRDLPALLAKHARGGKALDFGCGTGRSSRFLKDQGYETTGVDISAAMVAKARELDARGTYHVIPDGDFSVLGPQRFDLVFAAFTFDNIPGAEWRGRLLGSLAGLLRPGGRIVLLDSTPEIYLHEWESFSTKDFPDNRKARGGDVVRIVMTTVGDRRPVEDLLWTDEDYRGLFREAGLDLLEVHHPLGRAEEPFAWVSETTVSPWVVYVLQAKA